MHSIWIEVISRYESKHKSKYVSTFGIIAITIITIALLALILTIAECFGRKGIGPFKKKFYDTLETN